MAKILAVADSHGSSIPLTIAERNLDCFDKVIFLGDFLDHEDKEYEEQKENFLKVMKFKKANPEKVKILIGNHDANYIVPELYGWQYEHETEIKKMILRNLEYIDLGFMAGKWIFTHAGVSGIWFYNQLKNDGFNIQDDKVPDIQFSNEFLNQYNDRLHNGDFSILRFTGITGYGDEITQNPLWIRPDSLKIAAVSGFNQVVGHTAVPDEERIQKKDTDVLLFLDSLPFYRNVYAEIDTETNQYEIKKFEDPFADW